MRKPLQECQIAEIFVEGQQYETVFHCVGEYLPVVRTRHFRSNPKDFMARCSKGLDCHARDILVGEYSHRSGR